MVAEDATQTRGLPNGGTAGPAAASLYPMTSLGQKSFHDVNGKWQKEDFEVKQGPWLLMHHMTGVASLHFAGDGKNPWLIEKGLCLQPRLQLSEQEGGAARLTNIPTRG